MTAKNKELALLAIKLLQDADLKEIFNRDIGNIFDYREDDGGRAYGLYIDTTSGSLSFKRGNFQ